MNDSFKRFIKTSSTIAVITLCVFGVVKCNHSEWYQAHELESEAQDRADAIPHVIQEVDGCKVYTFKSADDYHYFTRCGDIVTTDRSYTQACGKNCIKHKTESIVTKGNR